MKNTSRLTLAQPAIGRNARALEIAEREVNRKHISSEARDFDNAMCDWDVGFAAPGDRAPAFGRLGLRDLDCGCTCCPKYLQLHGLHLQNYGVSKTKLQVIWVAGMP